MPSSILSSENAPAQRVPAWKRLGLKLKPASEEHPSNSATPTPAGGASTIPNGRAHANGSIDAKRKPSGAPALEQQSAKRARQDNYQTPKKTKSVTFAADTLEASHPTGANGTATPTKQLKPSTVSKVVSKPLTPRKQAPVNLEPALAYLRQWHTSRETWKFNKNHQTKLLQQVFADDGNTIPASDIGTFYEYIQDLKGGVRTRLKQLAEGIRAQDMEQGAEGFSASASAPPEMAEKKQKEYEDVIRTFLGQSRSPEKRRFDEVDYALRTTDAEMHRRVVKRVRAETVLDELSGLDETETASSSTTTGTTTTPSDSTGQQGGASSGGGAEKNTPDQKPAGGSSSGAGGAGEDGDKRLKLNDGSQQRVKRRRKMRTNAVDEESSSESDESEDSEDLSSDSEAASAEGSASGSSSSSSESEDDEDEEMASGPTRDELETSSSSSSSSSSSASEASDSESQSEEEEQGGN